MPPPEPSPEEPARPGGASRLPSSVFVGGLCAWALTDRELAPFAAMALALVAWAALRGLPDGRGARRTFLGAGLVLLVGALAWRLAYGPELAPLREAPKGPMLEQATLSIVLEGLGMVLGEVPRIGPALVAAAAIVWSFFGQPRLRALVALAFAAAAGFGWRWVPYPLEGPEGVHTVLAYAPQADRSDAALISPVPLPGPEVATTAVRRVGLVMVESAAIRFVLDDLERRPDSAFARVARRGLLWRDVLAPANASHLGQPALLHSHDFSAGVGWSPNYERVVPPTWSFPAFFRSIGWRTEMVSGQDETWADMGRFTYDLPWHRAQDQRDEPDEARVYRDADNTRKVHDWATRERALALLDAEAGPLFLYVVFQDSHFGYVLPGEDEPWPWPLRTFVHMPPDWAPRAEERYRASLAASLDHAAALVEAHPEMLWVFAGDHGESLEAGFGFAHAKLARVEEAGTFVLFVGPGVAPGADDTLRSTVDVLPAVVERVAPGLLDGGAAAALDGAVRPPGIAFTYSAGLREFSVAAVDEQVQLQVRAAGVECTARGEGRADPARCAAARGALDGWLRCKLATGRGEGPAPDACFRAGRAAWRSPVAEERIEQAPGGP